MDIEECVLTDVTSNNRHSGKIVPRGRSKNHTTVEKGSDESFPPGQGKVFVHTFGCGHNVSDGEYMAGQLADKGYTITDDFKYADCYLINSCTVKNPSEDHFVTMLKRARSTGKPVVVAGCVPQGDPENKEWADVSTVGVRQIDRVGEVVQEAMNGNVVRYMSTDDPSSNARARKDAVNQLSANSLPSLDLPKIRRNAYIEIVPINIGCLNNCTYCKTKHARGDLVSWPIKDLIHRIRQVIAEGVREIRLTSEDTGAYGIDLGIDAVMLLDAVVKEVEGTTIMVRLGMSNPPYLLKQLEGFSRIMHHPNVYEFLHLPVQSGSDAILSEMKREYTVEEFTQCCNVLQAKVPNISIATDIICAFPGEGEREWQETMDLCRRVRFPILNISRFYSRSGTPAAAMPQIPSEISKRRSVEITVFYNSYTTYDNLVGTKHEYVSLLELAHDKKHYVGHTKGYVQILVPPEEANLGDCVDLIITESSKYSVKGKVLKNYGALLKKPLRNEVHTSSKRLFLTPKCPFVGVVLISTIITVIFLSRKLK
eukprot:Tbor_TRINITY_DN4009_c0_g1::TRINITY_DN4009_c0_g1_i1::g.11834::m.11834/K15865/CDKAL1; threonylcarbamoyladenosine tRNA methylthiotransferase CDKAL1